MQTPLLFETIQQEGKETEHVIILVGTGGRIVLPVEVVREEPQEPYSWDSLTDGTGSDSRLDQLQPAMTLFLLFPWVTSSSVGRYSGISPSVPGSL